MYSHHHYNHDNLSRENANAHPLGRPASMPSLYPSSSSNDNYKIANEDLIQQRASLDGHGPYSNHAAGAATGTSHSWATPNSNSSSGWNHNPHHDNNIGGSTHYGSNSSTTVTSPPPPPPPLSSIMNTNHADNNTASSSSTTTTTATTSPIHHIKSNMDLPSIDKHYSNSPSANLMSAYNSSPNYFVSPTTTNAVYNSPHLSHHHHQAPSASSPSTASHHQQQQQSSGYSAYGMTSTMPSQARHSLVARPKLTTTLWEDEGTICYQVDANGICVARRQDNDMINGTKLLNVAGMSRGKRDGILKNEKGRVVVKVGAMHLKGVWITFVRAKLLAAQYKIQEILYPLFVEDPSVFLYATALHNPINASRMNGLNSYRTQQYGSFNSSSSPSNAVTGGATSNASAIHPTSPTNWDRHNNESNTSSYRNAGFHGSMMNHPSDDMFMLSSQVEYSSNNNNNNNNSSSNSSNNHGGHSNRQSIGGLVGGYNSNTGSNGPYSVYQQHQDKPSQGGSNNRMYFSDELLDDGGGKQDQDSSLYGHKSMLPGSLTSPTSSEAGNKASAFHLPPSRGSGEYDSNATTTTTSSSTTSTSTSAERRQSLIMSTPRVASPRHHPYMSPGKVYTPSIMSSLQSYRQSSLDEDRKDGDIDSQQQQHNMAAAAAAAADINRHPW
ncbi:hypothetical protein MBANPS3_001386 [Mucor bainieri]